MSRLELVPLHFSGPPRLLTLLREKLATQFCRETRIRPLWFDVETTYDSARAQYNSNLILQLLLTGSVDEGVKLLGVTSVDLFVPVLTFVFGEAQLGGTASVVSSHRLDNRVYGLPPSETLLLERLEKEAVHELGHAFGLMHCRELDCVMRSSTYVEEIDLKSASFCHSCSSLLPAQGA